VAAALKRLAGHRDNILRESFTETGVGVCHHGETYYFAQVFLRPLSKLALQEFCVGLVRPRSS
jgi:hypothetical protein